MADILTVRHVSFSARSAGTSNVLPFACLCPSFSASRYNSTMSQCISITSIHRMEAGTSLLVS